MITEAQKFRFLGKAVTAGTADFFTKCLAELAGLEKSITKDATLRQLLVLFNQYYYAVHLLERTPAGTKSYKTYAADIERLTTRISIEVAHLQDFIKKYLV